MFILRNLNYFIWNLKPLEHRRQFMPTILLIEDDSQCARMVTKLMTPHDYEIHHAANALTGLQLARKVQPDLILVDMDLPDLDGKVVVTQLRGLAMCKNATIVAFTANPDPRAKRRALAVGCDYFVTKPIDTQTFPELINQMINKEAIVN
jgi:two-component system, cell cycle response regulator DivK